MRNPFNFEAEPFEFESGFDEYGAGQSAKPCQCHQHSKAEYESDFEREPFEIYPEFDEPYEMEKGPDWICRVLYKDFKKMWDSLGDLADELRWKQSQDKIKKARTALTKNVARIEERLRGGWYAWKGCKESDFNFIIAKAEDMRSDSELKKDQGVQNMSKKLSDHARKEAQRTRLFRKHINGSRPL